MNEDETGASASPAGELLAEQFRSLASQVPTMYMILVTNAFFLQFVTSEERWDPRSYLAPMALAVIAVLRTRSWWRISGGALPGEADMKRAMAATKAVALIVALGIAVWSIYVLRTADPLRLSYVPLFTALTAITCAACLIGLPIAA